MPVRPTPTLSELRLDIADELGVGAQVRRSVALHDRLDSAIRSAFHHLVNMSDWVPMRVQAEIDLTHGVHSYDLPDGIPPGWIERDPVIVRSTDNRAFEVRAGIDNYIRDRYSVEKGDGNIDENVGLPFVWDVWDSQIQLYPAPDVTTGKYVTLRMLAKTEPQEPRTDGDISWVHGGVHKLMALRFYLLTKKPDVANIYRAEALDLLRRVRAQQSPLQSAQIGPARVSRFNLGLSGDAIRPARWGYSVAPSSERAWTDGVSE